MTINVAVLPGDGKGTGNVARVLGFLNEEMGDAVAVAVHNGGL